ncbi:S1 RNA-binding domain-containing protein [Salinibacter ruber]|uniref:S1 RNA-binding domain-containing protein n=1 Tax=Salinibacter ruber TaxID=146919 RepID=UPI002168663E|nr:S1 RNA-binding domain-containing protein [Salinibacter ruber]MCS4039908.1 ribosomal protein S1/gas vesicle protein [Salinibacter ruber]
MAKKSNYFEEKKLFQLVRELNVSENRILDLLREEGYESAISGSGVSAKIVNEEAYLVLRKEYGDDSEAAARLRELREDNAGREGESAPPEPGETVTATTERLHSKHGAFVSVGAYEGRIRTDKLAWMDFEAPEEIVQPGEEVECVVENVKRIDGEQKLELSRKKALPSPWKRYEVGDVLEGEVSNVTDFGVFVDLEYGGTGLVHESEMSWTEAVNNPEEKFEIGGDVIVCIIDLDSDEKQIDLSRRRVSHQNLEVSDLPAVESQHSAEVRHIDLEDGVLVELSPGIDGRIPSDKLYWDRIVTNPSEVDFSSGDEIEVVVVDLSEDGPNITLSQKHTRPDPWGDYAAQYTEGSVHEAEVRSITDNSVVARLLPDGPDVEVHWKQLADGFRLDEEGDPVKKDLTDHYGEGARIQVRIRRFDADKEAVYVSETAVQDDIDDEWRSYAERFYQRSEHPGTVVGIEDDGTMDVQLPDGPKAILPKTLRLQKPEANDDQLKEEDTIAVQVHHFSLKNREVVLEELNKPLEEIEPPYPWKPGTQNITQELVDAVFERVQPKLKDQVRGSFSRLKEELTERIPKIIERELQDRELLGGSEEIFKDLPEGLLDEIREAVMDETEDLVEEKVSEWYEISEEDIQQLKDDLEETAESEKENLEDWIEDRQEELCSRHNDRVQSLKEAVGLSFDDERSKKAPEPPSDKFEGEEWELIRHIIQYTRGQGLYYDEEVIENFYTCLKCDDLVILSGLSGVGKSKLPKHVAEAIGGIFEMEPVRPNWNDDRDLLGYYNPRTGSYQSTTFLDTLIEASENRDRLYILCLDEMNLAPPEYYFALFLSKLESDADEFHPDPSLSREVLQSQKREILAEILELEDKLKEVGAGREDSLQYQIKALRRQIDELSNYYEVQIPPNVKFVGTVNVDQTTEGFSDKVLDRANVIQFESPDLKNLRRLDQHEDVSPKLLPFSEFQEFASVEPGVPAEKPLSDYDNHLTEINEFMSGSLGFGYRVYNAVLRYMKLIEAEKYYDQSQGNKGLSLDEAFDSQLIQRVLPKIRGMDTKDISSSLKNFKSFLDGESEGPANMEDSKTADRLRSMIDQLDDKGYVNYWEV